MLTETQIEHIRDELNRRRLLLEKRLSRTEQKKSLRRSPRKSKSYTEIDGTRIKIGSERKSSRKTQPVTREEIEKAARTLGVTPERLKEMGI